jgi:hypothetical protein
MSSVQFERVLKSAKLSPNDRKWFAKWLDGYRKSCQAGRNDRVPVDRELLVAFLRDQKAKGRKAWQRLQIVRAITGGFERGGSRSSAG